MRLSHAIFGLLLGACVEHHKNSEPATAAGPGSTAPAAGADLAHIKALFLTLAAQTEGSSDPAEQDTAKLAKAVGQAPDAELHEYLTSGHVETAAAALKDDPNAPNEVKNEATQAVAITMITLGSLYIARALAALHPKLRGRFNWPFNSVARGADEVSKKLRDPGVLAIGAMAASFLAPLIISSAAIGYGTELLNNPNATSNQNAKDLILGAGVVTMILGINQAAVAYYLQGGNGSLVSDEEMHKRVLDAAAQVWETAYEEARSFDEQGKHLDLNDLKLIDSIQKSETQGLAMMYAKALRQRGINLGAYFPRSSKIANYPNHLTDEEKLRRAVDTYARSFDCYSWKDISKLADEYSRTPNRRKFAYYPELKREMEEWRILGHENNYKVKNARPKGRWGIAGAVLGAGFVAISQTTLNLAAEPKTASETVAQLNAAIKAYSASH